MIGFLLPENSSYLYLKFIFYIFNPKPRLGLIGLINFGYTENIVEFM